MPQKVEIELNGEEQEELRRLARSESSPFREVRRARMIIYSAEGMTDGQIAERLDCTPECVGKWRRSPWLHEDAIRPWQVRSWIFLRDPDFLAKALRVLDLYARRFEGRRLRPDEHVISADEKSQLQALGRPHATMPPGPDRNCASPPERICGQVC